MSFRSFLCRALVVLLSACLPLTLYLYLYPVSRICSFPSPPNSKLESFKGTLLRHLPFADAENNVQPVFRLLTLADPQLEGDSSLPPPEDGFLPRTGRRWEAITQPTKSLNGYTTQIQKELSGWLFEDLKQSLQAFRKRVDLFGNDYYLAHIYRTLHWWTKPTHVTVLGDLIGSQWVTDDEFEWRGWRYWNRVFRSSHNASPPAEDSPVLDPTAWNNRIINVVGNHDIGYAGDITSSRMSRFERIFGPPDWDTRFHYPPDLLPPSHVTPPTLHLINFNTLNLDTPAFDSELQSSSYAYLNDVISSRSFPVGDDNSFTLLLTHLPLHKPAGVCVDPPHFAFFEEDDEDQRYKKGGLREQNHLSEHVSHQGILQGLYGMSADANAVAGGRGRRGLILTGHDHEGCDVWHFAGLKQSALETEDQEGNAQSTPEVPTKGWLSIPYRQRNLTLADTETGIREVTLRSMMGGYGGNAGLLSAWFDFEKGRWDFEITMCPLGTQHWWWAVHVLDFVTIGLALLWAACEIHSAQTSKDGKKESVGRANGLKKDKALE
ncbi:MAG: hypothetical protein Q9227_000273 [Pyrenula ochraceoflavens]